MEKTTVPAAAQWLSSLAGLKYMAVALDSI
jgi:hypothetical protein